MFKPKPSILSRVKNSILSLVGKTNIVRVIEFRPHNKTTEIVVDPPVPASKAIPDWYKNLSIYRDKAVECPRHPAGDTNLTMKACIPVLDALVSGYIITLPCDVIFVDPEQFNGNRVIWDVSWKVITSHTAEQVGNIAPVGHDPRPLKWEGVWEVTAPPGYSLLYTHPFYRFDLPFTTATAIVDSDKFSKALNLPFFIKDGYMGTIPKGTPIAQVIPIKRETWYSTIEKYDERSDYIFDSIKTTFFRAYKNNWWTKKTYN
jgi:hypothetical protein